MEPTASLVIVGLLLALWNYSSRLREKAHACSLSACREIGVQRLDDTASLSRISVRRNAEKWCLEFVYRFEFSSNGVDRHFGHVRMLCAQIDSIHMDHPDGAIFLDPPYSTGSIGN
ncbi:MAG: DUF3301 domain-containing protein [Pseudomonadota bacterium]